MKKLIALAVIVGAFAVASVSSAQAATCPSNCKIYASGQPETGTTDVGVETNFCIAEANMGDVIDNQSQWYLEAYGTDGEFIQEGIQYGLGSNPEWFVDWRANGGPIHSDTFGPAFLPFGSGVTVNLKIVRNGPTNYDVYRGSTVLEEITAMPTEMTLNTFQAGVYSDDGSFAEQANFHALQAKAADVGWQNWGNLGNNQLGGQGQFNPSPTDYDTVVPANSAYSTC